MSYVWGDSKDQQVIRVGNSELHVNRNLYAALRQISLSEEVHKHRLKFWIDAICINQNDLDERTTEVKKMYQIYSEAVAVRAWLGSVSVEQDSNLIRLRQCLDEFRHASLRNLPVVDAEAYETIFEAFTAIALEPYWERIWIMQEISSASSLTFWLGRWCFEPYELIKLQLMLDQRKPTSEAKWLQNSPRFLRNSQRLMQLRLASHDSVKLDLHEIVTLAQSAYATDERDRVYGLLALLPENITEHIQVDYRPESSLSGLFRTFSKICLPERGGLGALARSSTGRLSKAGFPSWMIDLTYQYEEDEWDSTSRSIVGKHYKADAGCASPPTSSESDTLMTCEGIWVSFVVDAMKWDMKRAVVDATLLKSSTDKPGNQSLNQHIQGDIASEVKKVKIEKATRLSLARTFLLDSHYEFSDGPSILDMPWALPDSPQAGMQDMLRHPRWQSTSEAMVESIFGLHNAVAEYWTWFVVQAILQSGADFHIKGIRFRKYFDTVLDDETPLASLHDSNFTWTMFVLARYQLFTLRNGLIGMGPKAMRVGDRVAVLLESDMPVVLRQKENITR